MPQLLQDESGQIFLDEGGGILTPMTEDQAQAYAGGQGAITGAAKAANQSIKNLASGVLGLVDDEYRQMTREGIERQQAMTAANPLLSGAAQFLPEVVMGAATGGAGLLPTAGAEAAIGAARSPDDPLQGALIGGALGGAAAALPGVAQWGAGKARQGMNMFQRTASLPDDVSPPGVLRPGAEGLVEGVDEFPTSGAADVPPPASAAPTGTYASQGGGQPPGAPPARMVDRVTETLEREAAKGQDVAATRVMGDLMTPDELAAYGVPVNPGQKALLEATTADPQAAGLARRLMADEEARRSSPAMGRVINEVMDRQKAAGTNFINDQFGVNQGIALTDGTVSEQMAYIGNRFDRLAEEMGGVPITKDIRDELAEVMRLSTGRHKQVLQRAIDEALQKADNAGGVLHGEDWLKMRTEFNKQIERGMKNGSIDWVNEASDVMDVFTRAMETRLPASAQAELRKLRKQYAIGSVLAKPGVRDGDGLVNPTSFYSNWKRPQSLKFRGKDDVGRFMNTIDTLTRKRVPDSGTATRVGRMAEEAGYSVPILGPIAKGLLGGGP